MLEYIRNKYSALYLTDAAGNPTPCDLLDGQGVSLLTGSTPVFLPPNAFAVNQWSVSTGSNPAQININVSVLPAAHGNPITALQYRVGNGAWVTLPAAITGTYPITLTATSTAYSISLQAINVVGPSGPSAAKTATSGAAATTAPAMFAPAQWTLATSGEPASLVLNVVALPADGGSAITALEYRVGSGEWVALSGTNTGPRTITMPAAGMAYSVVLRAVNAVGSGAPSAAKTATSAAPQVDLTITNANGVLDTAAAGTVVATIITNATSTTLGGADVGLLRISGSNNVVTTAAITGKTGLSFSVTGSRSGYANRTTTTTVPVSPATAAPSVQTNPTITGNTVVGSTITRAAGTAIGTPTPSRATRWLRNGSPILNQTGNTLSTSGFAPGNVITTEDVWTNSEGSATGASQPITLTAQPTLQIQSITSPILAGQIFTVVYNVELPQAPQGNVTFTGSGTTWTATAPSSGSVVFSASAPGYETLPSSYGVQSGTPITTNIGSVASYEPNGDTPAFTLTGTGNAKYNKRFVVPTSVTVDGYGHMAEPMTLNTDTSGPQPTWTIAALPLIVWPADDVGEFMISIRASGIEVATQFPYTRDPGDALRKVSAFVVLPNAKSELDGATVEYEVVLQEAVSFTYTPRFFPSGSPPSYVRWSLPNGIGAAPGHLFFTRFVLDPTEGDTTFGTTIFALTGATLGDVKTGIQINNDSSPQISVVSRSSPYSNLGGTLVTKKNIDVFASITDSGAAKGMLSIDGGTWSSFAQGGGPDSYVGIVAAQIAGVRMNRAANGLSQYSHRAVFWPGVTVDPEHHIAKFIKGDGSLEHPLVAVNAFGTPAIDFYNNANHGSFGAPTTTVG